MNSESGLSGMLSSYGYVVTIMDFPIVVTPLYFKQHALSRVHAVTVQDYPTQYGIKEGR